MPDARMIRRQIEERIKELDAIMAPLLSEYDQLKSVAASFVDNRPARPPAAPPRARRAPRNAPASARGVRAPRSAAGAKAPGGGSRSQQAVELIAAGPGVSAADLAKSMGISRNYLYRVLPKLEQRGVIRKQGRGYVLAASTNGEV